MSFTHIFCPPPPHPPSQLPQPNPAQNDRGSWYSDKLVNCKKLKPSCIIWEQRGSKIHIPPLSSLQYDTLKIAHILPTTTYPHLLLIHALLDFITKRTAQLKPYYSVHSEQCSPNIALRWGSAVVQIVTFDRPIYVIIWHYQNGRRSLNKVCNILVGGRGVG